MSFVWSLLLLADARIVSFANHILIEEEVCWGSCSSRTVSELEVSAPEMVLVLVLVKKVESGRCPLLGGVEVVKVLVSAGPGP